MIIAPKMSFFVKNLLQNRNAKVRNVFKHRHKTSRAKMSVAENFDKLCYIDHMRENEVS